MNILTCPSCKGRLSAVSTAGVTVEECPHCGGVWCDAGELRPVLRRLAASPETEDDELQSGARRIVRPQQARRERRLCPKDGSRLGPFNYAYDSNVFLDRCPRCNGLWVDGQDLPRLARHLKGNPAQDRLGQALVQHQVEQAEQLERMSEQGGKPSLAAGAGSVLFGAVTALPISDETPIERLPLVTIGLIAANVLVFVLTIPPIGVVPWEELALHPEQVIRGERLGGLLSHMFIHAGVFHIGFNMLFLWVFGNNVEDRFGSFPFLCFYLFAGVAAAATEVAMNPDSTLPVGGASGAVAGTLGAYLVLYPRSRLRMLFFFRMWSVSAFAYLAVWFAVQVAGALIIREESGVAFAAHAGGFVTGALVAVIVRVVERKRPGELV